MKGKSLLSLVGLNVLLIFLSLSAGSADISWTLPLSAEDLFILVDLRLPRTLSAFWIGGLLSCTGLALQNLLKNPLAEPYTLGLSGAASFGSILAVYFGLTPFLITMPMGAFLFCLLTSLFLLSSPLSSRGSQGTLIIAGVMLSLFFGSLVLLIMSLLPSERLSLVNYFFLGYLGSDRNSWWWLFLPVGLLVGTWFWWRRHDLDRLQLGDTIAASLGVSVFRMRREIILVSTLVVSTCVSIAGLIGFVGLMGPHIARRFAQENRHRVLLPFSFLVGSALLIFADTLTRLAAPDRDVPAGGIMALLGAPLVIYLLSRGGHRVES